jgi:tRNA-dihydrouridine synthase
MAGISHTAFRRLVSELGGVGLLFTEMLSARSLPVEDPRRSPYLLRTPGESPLFYQVLVSEPEEIAPAFAVLHGLGADGIDLNFGCPAPQARRRGAGSFLAERPEAARAILAEARRRTPLPLTAKIRLGETLDEQALRGFCTLLEAEGIDLVTVHARLRREPYGRPPRWPWIGKVKAWVSVPVVGNGGIFSVEEAQRCLRLAACDGLMLGRGAVVRPWLGGELAGRLYGAGGCGGPPRSLASVFARFADLLEESFPPERCLGRLRQFTHYFSQNYEFGHHLAAAVQSSVSLTQARERAAAFFAGRPDRGAASP